MSDTHDEERWVPPIGPVDPEIGRVVVSHAWYDQEVPMISPAVNLAQVLPWTYHQVVALGKTVTKSGVDSIPANAVADREAFVQFGIRSSLALLRRHL